MAKKKEPEIQARILTKSIPYVRLDGDEIGLITITDHTSGWELVDAPALASPDAAAVWSGYIDLTGMTVTQDLSLAVQAVDIQESFPVAGVQVAILNVWDIVSDVPIDWSVELGLFSGSTGTCPFPGQLGSTRNLEKIVQGRFRTYTVNSTIPNALILVQDGTWGVNAATASDRLYIYRVVHGGSAATSPGIYPLVAMEIPPATFAMPVIFFEEAGLAHMERLRRSNILQGPFS